MSRPLHSIALLAMLVTTPVAAQQQQTVQFRSGATSAVVPGAIRGYQFVDYKLGLRAGQQLSVSLTRLRGSPYFNVMEPGEKDVAIFTGATSGDRYAGRTRRSGTYTLRVYQMRASARRGETASFRLNVSASARGPAGGPPGDAMVAGTPYHATGAVRCRVDASGRWGNCKAGVIRRANGSATVHLDTIDGGQRSILFRDGKAVSSDGEGRFSVTRRGDTSFIQIGQYETYEIPDALPFGG